MILMKMYFIVFVTLLSFLGCASAKQEAKPQAVLPIKNSLKKEPLVEKTTFNKENLTQEDVQTKVFQNCFKTGSINLEKKCQVKIDKFLRETSLKHKRSIYIDVHTDKGGSNKKNLLISNKRAKNIAGSLYYKEYKNSKVYYQGFGESKLIYNDETPESNIKNRRVVVKLRSKNFKVNNKHYRIFVKRSANKQRKALKKKTKKTKQKEKLSISKYTGQADIGWIYFGKYNLAKKLTISCRDDKPRKEKHKAISRGKKKEFMSAFYNRKINGSYSGGEIEVSPIYIYENGKLPISNPILTLKQKNKEVVRFQTTINTYRGKKGILYRIFVNGKKDVSCVDLVISYKDDKVSYGRIYTKDKREYKLKNLR